MRDSFFLLLFFILYALSDIEASDGSIDYFHESLLIFTQIDPLSDRVNNFFLMFILLG